MALALGAGIHLQNRRCRQPTRIGEDLGELRKQDDEERLDRIFVPRQFVTQLHMQTDQFAIAGDLFIWDIAHPCLAAEQDPRDRVGVQAVGLRSQSSLLGKFRRLSGMQQTQVIALSLQKVEEILSVARSRLQTHDNLSGSYPQAGQPLLQKCQTRRRIRQLSRFDSHLFLGRQNGKTAFFAANIHAHDRRKR